MGKWIRAAAALAALGSVTGAAEAAVFTVSYTSAGTSFSGSFTTTDTPDGNGFLTVTGITGTRNGSAATLLVPNTFPQNVGGANDNLFKPTLNYFTVNGVSYSAGGTFYNIYSLNNGALRECISNTTNGCSSGLSNVVSNFTINGGNGAVPEPATWAMMIMGFGMVGGAMRRRRMTVAYA